MRRVIISTALLIVLLLFNHPAWAASQIFTANTLIDSGDLTYEGYDLIVGDGSTAVTLTINGKHSFNSLTIMDKATVNHSKTDITNTYSLDLNIAGDLNIQVGGKITGDGRGYLGGWQGGNQSVYGRTTGNETLDGSRSAYGGSHGGLGGAGSCSTGSCEPGSAYGDLAAPGEPGAGGGAWSSSYPGGNGGGLIRLIVVGVLTNDGVISVNGVSPAPGKLAGGGAGGGISLNVNTLAGGGLISAIGGDGGTYAAGYTEGGGGGGRIAIYYQTKTFTGTVNAYGGSGKNGGGHGGAGTIYWKQSSREYGDLVVYNNHLTPAEASTPLSSTSVIFDNVTISNDGRVWTSTLAMVTGVMALNNGWYTQGSDAIQLNLKTLNLSNGAVFTHSETTISEVKGISVLVTGDMTIDTTSSMNSDGRGFLGGWQGENKSVYGRTAGNQTLGGSRSAYGGSHGGLGGAGSCYTGSCEPGSAYGDLAVPREPGAGGGAWSSSYPGGNGGGLIRLIVGGVLTNDGVISVNGVSPAPGKLAGGGAGGGISLNVGALAGVGLVSANGGAGGTYASGYKEGGGGGGRIAIYYSTKNFSGIVNAYGGPGKNGGGHGGAGTIYWKQASLEYGDLVVDNALFRGTSTDITDTTLTDQNASWAASSLVGLRVNPDTSQTTTFTIAANDATTLTISGGLAAAAKAGDKYVIYRPSSEVSTTTPFQIYQGTSDSDGGINSHILNDSTASWRPNAFTGLRLNPNRNRNETFTITGNTETTISVEGDLSQAATAGDPYSIARVSFDNVTFSGGAYVGLEGFPLITNQLTISEHAILTHFDTTTLSEPLLQVTATDLTVDLLGRINVGGRGYLGGWSGGNGSNYGRTAGNVTTGGSSGTSGGSHGGLGGIGYGSGAVGPAYGSDMAPGEPGAGGGAYNSSHPGGDGGGVILLEAAGTFKNEGVIAADGHPPPLGNKLAGGGAGGSILIKAGQITGSGLFTATGGNGGTYSSYGTGGGGGGRIAILSAVDVFTGNVTVSGGSGQYTGTSGGEGTIYRGQRAFGDLSVVMAVSPDPAFKDNKITYTITVRNDGPSEATGVIVTNALPSGVTLDSAASSQGNCTVTTAITCEIGSLVQSGEATVTIAIIPSNVGVITNTVNVAADEVDLYMADNSATEVTEVFLAGAVADLSITVADLSITVADSIDPATAGEVLTYTITVNNAGPSEAVNVILQDVITLSIQQPEYSLDNGSTWNNWTGLRTIGNIAAGDSVKVLLRGNIDPSFSGLIVNTASVQADTLDPDRVNNSGTELTTVIARADLSIAMTGSPDPVVAGLTIVYTVDITNAGPSDALNVSMRDTLPGQVQSPEYSLDNGTSWNSWPGILKLGDLTVGLSINVLLRAMVNPSATGTMINTATLKTETYDPDLSSNTTEDVETAINAVADLSLTASDIPDPVPLGYKTTHTIILTNNGPSYATSVFLTEVLPEGAVLVSAASTSGSCSGTTLISCNIGTMANNKTVTVNIASTFTSLGNFTSVVQVASGTTDPEPSNNAVSIDTTVVPVEERRVLLINVSGSYNADGNNIYQTLLRAGAAATYINLSQNGQAAALIQANTYDQVWVFDLSSGADNYPSDWQAVADWFKADPSRAIIADARMISSYWKSRWTVEGQKLTENYFFNMKEFAGGILLGTDHDVFQAGINTINELIGLQPFQGNFSLTMIPVDTGNILMTTPNDMGPELSDDSSPGQTPYGLQPNGRILYTLAWHSNNINTPGISSTIQGDVGFRVDIVSPAPYATVFLGETVTFQAVPSNGDPPFSYDWSSSLDGYLGSGETQVVSNLSLGVHQIKVLAQDGGGGYDDDTLQITVIEPPDLTVTEIARDPVADMVDGERVTFTATIENGGTGPTAGNFPVDFLMDGKSIGSKLVSKALASHETIQVSQVWTALPGAHNLEVKADSAGQIREWSEENNSLMHSLPEIGFSELTVSDITWNPPGPVQGEKVTFTATVSNTGATTLRAFYVNFKMDGNNLGSLWLTGGMAGGGSRGVSREWTAAAGGHTITAEADSTKLVTESDEGNNILSKTLQEISSPDLIVSGITWTPAQPVQGESVTFTAAIQNTGASTLKDFYVEFRVDSQRIGSQRVSGGLGTGAATLVSQTWTVTTGAHTVEAFADSTRVISETDEQNNTYSETMTEILPSDLTITEITWEPVNPVAGDLLTLTANVDNVGAGATASTFYLQFKIDETILANKPVTGGLAAGASQKISQTWTAQPGLHTVEALADATRVVPESNEDNNSLLQDLPEILAPDLTVAAIAWMPLEITEGKVVTFTAAIRNTGTGSTLSSFKVEFFLDGASIGERTVFGLEAGVQKEISQSWPAGAGSHTVKVVVDSRGEVAEADEENNIMSVVLPEIADITPPVPPTVNPVTSPTNMATQTLRGTKEAHSSIWINGAEVIPVEANTTWSYQVLLVENVNNFDIYSRDASGNQSSPVSVAIIQDTVPPVQVTSLTTVSGGDGFTVLLDWTGYDEQGQGDIAYYRVYREEQGYSQVGALIPIVTVPAGIFTYKADGLEKGKTYYFAVVAVDRAGNALNTVMAVAASPSDIVPPKDVTNLRVQSFDTRLVFSWNHSISPDLANYKVYFNGTAEGVLVSSINNSHEFTGLDPASAYPLKITALDNDGNESSGVSLTGVTLLPNPANLAAAPRNGYVDLTWEKVVPSQYVKYYAVYADTQAFTSVEGLTPRLMVTGMTARVTKLSNGTTYYFAVTAVNSSGGERKEVSTVAATPVQRPEIITVKGNYVSPVSAVSDFSLTIRFDSSMDTVVEPLIEITGTGSSNPVVPPGGVWLTTFKTNDTYATPRILLSSGMDGSLRVSISGASDKDDNTMLPVTNAYEFILDATPPENPSVTLASKLCDSATLAWADYAVPPDLAGFRVYQSVGSTFSTVKDLKPIQWLSKYARSYKMTSLQLDTPYYIAMVAVDGVGNMLATVNPIEIMAGRTLPPQVATLVSPGIEADSAVVSWAGYQTNNLCGFAIFDLYFQESDFTSVEGLSPALSLAASDREFTVTGLDRNRVYYFAVVGVNAAGEFLKEVSTARWSDPYGGDVTSDTIIGGGEEREVVIYQNMVVKAGATLTVKPGTILYFSLNTGLVVEEGSLIAEGTALEPIIFTSLNDRAGSRANPADWNGLVLTGRDSGSVLRHVFIKYGKGLTLDGPSPTVEAITALYNMPAGITLINGASLSTSSALLAYNETGIQTTDTSQTVITGSVIKGNTINAMGAGGITVEAPGNWWGSIDESAIAAKTSGNVNYAGFLEFEPLLTPALGTLDGNTQVGTEEITLKLACRTAEEMRVSEDSAFTGVFFVKYQPAFAFKLSEGGGEKTIYAQFKSVTGAISEPISIQISYITEGPVINLFSLTEGQIIQRPLVVTAGASAALGMDSLVFFADNLLLHSASGTVFSYLWDVRNDANGIHRVKILARDRAGNVTTLEKNVILDITAPPAPTILEPAGNLILSAGPIKVSGTAEPFITVNVTRNAFAFGTTQAGEDGTFEIGQVSLVEGDNRLMATAYDHTGVSPNSNVVTVVLDSGPPAAPVLLEPIVRPGEGVALKWRFADEGERPTSFRVYRHVAFFREPGEAQLLADQILTNTFFDSSPPDGLYYYAVVGLDSAGNTSELSNLVSTNYDSIPPSFQISYDPQPPFGVGVVNVTITSSEALAHLPTLTITPFQSRVPHMVSLNTLNDLTFTGAYTITPQTPSGMATIYVSGRDLAGNVFSGKYGVTNFIIDTEGPYGAIATNPVEPVQVIENVQVEVTLYLSKPAKEGTTPMLRFIPPEGASVDITLTGSGMVWTGSLTLVPAMGNGFGQFSMEVEDGLGNPGRRLTSGETLEIYNTETPTPTEPPAGLVTASKAGGQISLTWGPVDKAESYRLYRKEGTCGEGAPTVMIAVNLTTGSYTDLPPDDGAYCYAVSAVRREAESERSNLAGAFSDRTPPNPPANLTVAPGKAGVVVSWQAPTEGEAPLKYHVYRNGQKIRTVSIELTIHDYPPAGGVYTYLVSSVDWIGNENFSDPAFLDLKVGAVSNLAVLMKEGDVPHLSWESSDPGVIGFNIYRGGIKLNSQPVTEKAYVDALYASASLVQYAVRAVNGEGEESVPRTVDVYPVDLRVKSNPDEEGNSRPLVANHFNKFEVSFLNNDPTQALDLDRLELTLAVNKVEKFSLTKALGLKVEGGTAYTGIFVVPLGILKVDYALNLKAVQVDQAGSTVIYQREFIFTDIRWPEAMIELSTDSLPTAGGYASVDLCVYNRGYSDMDIVVSRQKGAQPGDLFVVLRNEDGFEIGRAEFNDVPPGSKIASDGTVYVTIPPDDALCVVVNILVPENLEEGSVLTFAGGLSRSYYRFKSSDQQQLGLLTGYMVSGITLTPYYGTAAADKQFYSSGETVLITGEAIDRSSGLAVPNVDLNLGFSTRGFNWFETVTTDDQGSYTYYYTPPAGSSGQYAIWATHPDVYAILKQAEFDIYRMYTIPARGEIRMSKADTLDFSIELYNPGEASLTGLTGDFRAYTLDESGLEVDETRLTGQVNFGDEFFQLKPGQRKRVNLRLSAATDAPDAANVEFTFTSTQGASAGFSAAVTLLPAVPVLAVEEPYAGYVDISLDRGSLVSRKVRVANKGLKDLLGVELLEPLDVAWIKTNLPRSQDGRLLLGDLKMGESRSFEVVFSPPADAEFGYHQDKIVLKGTNAEQEFIINLYAMVTSNLVGAAQFVVLNTLGQEVKGATIRLRNTKINKETKPVVTDDFGEGVVTGLQEGEWSWQVTAPGHANYADVVNIIPDQTAPVEVFLIRNLVTVNFRVEPVPFTDRYEIKIEQVFETHVPLPVLITEPSSFEFRNVVPGFETSVVVTVKNYGLVKLEDVTFSPMETAWGGKLEPLIAYLPELGAMQSIDIPYKFVFMGIEMGKAEEEVPVQSSPQRQLAFKISGPNIWDFTSPADWADEIAGLFDEEFGNCVKQGHKEWQKALEQIYTLKSEVRGRGYCAYTPRGSGQFLEAAKAIFWIVYREYSAIIESVETVITLVACTAQFMKPPPPSGGGTGIGWGWGGGGPAGGSGTTGIPWRPVEAFVRAPACFTAGTPITLGDGTQKPIEEIRVGDQVLTVNGEVDRVKRVEKRQVDHIREIRFQVGDSPEIRRLETTDEHLFWVEGKGWTLARLLETGDELVMADGSGATVIHNERVNRPETVYNFDVEKNQSYFANGVLVHQLCTDDQAEHLRNK